MKEITITKSNFNKLHSIQEYNEAPAVGTFSWYITGLQVLNIASLVTYYKQITNSLHEQECM